MAFTKITHAGIGSTGTVLLENLEVTGVGTFGGSVSVGGTLTYEDVTNIDSVGLITARAGVVVGSGITLSQDGDIFATGITTVSGNIKVGTGITLSPDGDGFFTGVITATSYSGIDLSNVTGAQGDFSIVDKIVHTGDTDTAIRFSGADTVNVETGGSERLRVDSTGQVRIFEHLYLTDNVPLYLGNANDLSLFHDGTDSRIRFNHTVGDLKFQNNSNDNLMVLDASGNLLIGTTTAAISSGKGLMIADAAGSRIKLCDSDSGVTSNDGFEIIANSSGEAYVWNRENTNLLFGTNNSERARIDSSGRLLLGSGAAATPKTGSGGLDVSQYGLSIVMGGSSGDSGQARANNTNKEARLVIPHYTNDEEPVVAIAAFPSSGSNQLNFGGGTSLGNAATEINFHTASNTTTTGSSQQWQIASDGDLIGTNPAVIHSGSSAGYLTLYGGATNHGGKILMYGGNGDSSVRFYSEGGTTDPTERLRIASNQVRHGSSNVLGGGLDSVRINNSSDYRGLVLRGTGGSGGMANHNEYVFLFNRMGSDGTIVAFNAQGSQEGSINVSGSTVGYNGGHLSRWSQLVGISTNVKSDRPTIYQGTVMSNLDEMCEWPGEENQQLNKTKVSDTVGDKNVAGVFWTWDDDDDVYTNDFYIAMVGDMVIRVAASTTVARGDLLESAGDGTAKPQSDDIVRSKTIAKITSTTSTVTYADGSKAYPCVLMGS